MILPIYIYGMSVLRKEAEDVTENIEELKPLLDDMFATLDQSGGIGLAAPQIGRAERVVVIDLDALKEDMPEYEGYRHAFINGYILEESEETNTSDEGCLSLPGISEKVERPAEIRATWIDENGVKHDEWVKGYLARVIQHEFDHLDGVMFIDHLKPLRKQMIKNKLKSLLQGKVRADYRYKVARR